jgi:transposase
LIPDDHVLVRVDRVLDLSWLRAEIADCYCLEDGRPGIDPEVAVRLMLAGVLLGIAHDRKLLREAHVNIAVRWFIGYGLHAKLPHHSSLTRIRQRWGPERFRQILKRTVAACLEARIATGEVVHIDASLIRANVSWDSLIERHVEAVLSENETRRRSRPRRGIGRAASTRRSASPIPTRPWPPTPATGGSSRPISSTPPLTTRWA